MVKTPASCHVLDVPAGPALGLLDGHRYLERKLRLGVGDVLVAVTDGVTDPLATESDRLGLAALARLVQRAPVGPAALCASLLGAAQRSGFCDDATVLAVAPALHAASAARLAVLQPSLAA